MRLSTHGAAALCALLCACGTDLPSYNEVQGLRILAISAEHPWLAPSTHTELAALIVSAEPVQYRWSWCPIKPVSEENFDCAILTSDFPLGLPDADLGQDPSAQFTTPSGAAIQQACEALQLEDCDSGMTAWVRLDLSSETDTLTALKALRLTTAPAPQQSNPNLNYSTARLGAQALTRLSTTTPSRLIAGQEYLLEATAFDGAFEAMPDGVTERLVATWFVDQGSLQYGRTALAGQPGSTNTWTLPEQPLDPLHLWVVLRDGRGGTSWKSYTLDVEAP